MRKLKIWIVFVPFFIMACSEENAVELAAPTYQSKSLKKSGSTPENSANPYDSAGRIYNEILAILDHTNFSSMSIEGITILIDSVSQAHPELIPSKSEAALSSRAMQIKALVNHSNPLYGIQAESNLGENAKASFSTFLNSLLLVDGSPYDVIHPLLVSYEATVLNSTVFSTNDKRIILTACAVARYSAAKRKRKDKDWETSVTNMVRTVSIPWDNSTSELKMAAVVAICKNNNVTQ